VIEEKDFQQRLQRIGGLLRDLEAVADPASRTAAKELVQLLMDLHGSCLERILEVIFQAGDAGTALIDHLGRDPLVSSLLVLYGIHPDDLETRVRRKLEQIQPRVRKMGAQAALVRVDGGNIRLQLKMEGHSCGSTARTLQNLVEEAMYEAAPDLTSVVVEGTESSSPGFVGLEVLTGSCSDRGASTTPALHNDRMD